MSPEYWQRIEEIFQQALELPSAERAAFLEKRKCEDSGVAHEVERLLRNVNPSRDFLESPALEPGDWDAAPKPAQPEQIGRYRVIRLIGHGGMGSVYLARRADDEYQQQVAIKVIRRGQDLDFVARRLRGERQILANLIHPHIGRLLDGGRTEDGYPYLVMEHIEGEPITRFCQRLGLTVAERLRLFQQVCSAVHYAHQRLIVHLDIKPGNVLVTTGGEGAVGSPKLLDFGIARVLDASTGAAGGDTTGVRPFTPDYASPEQIRGAPANVTSDVYSLGVMLYELLSGERPLRLDEPAKPEAARPSVEHKNGNAGARGVEGELGTIVSMAMHAEPDRRYASAAQLSEDIDRHLRGFPVLARKDSFSYRARKFLTRHKTALSAAGMILFALVGGLISTAWQAKIATNQRRLAEQRLSEFLKLTHSLLYDYQDSIAHLVGSTPVRLRLARDTFDYLNQLAREAEGNGALRRELATAYLRVGDLQGRPYSANIGDTAGALASYGRAIEELEALDRANPNDELPRSDLSNAYDAMGRLLTRTGDYKSSVKNLRSALQIRLQLTARHPGNEDYQERTGYTWLAMGDPLLYQRHFQDAIDAYEHADEILHRLCSRRPGDLRLRRQWASSQQRLGSAYDGIATSLADTFADAADARKAWQVSLEKYRSALNEAERLVDTDPRTVEFRRAVADSSADTARVMERLGDGKTALSLQQRAVEIFRQLSEADPTNQESKFDLLITTNGLAADLAKSGDTRAAFELYEQSVRHLLNLAHADPANREMRSYISGIYGGMVRLMLSANQPTAALHYAEAELKFDQESSGLYVHKLPWRTFVAGDMAEISQLMALTGQRAGSLEWATRALAEARQNALRADAEAADLAEYGKQLLWCPFQGLRDPANAIACLKSSLDRQEIPDPNVLLRLALAYEVTGSHEKAMEAATRAAAIIPYPKEASEPESIQRNLAALVADFKDEASLRHL